VESLSELLEKPVDSSTILETKQLILDKTVYVGSRREIVLKDTLQGLSESRWSYNVEI
jgi:ariadne-1